MCLDALLSCAEMARGALDNEPDPGRAVATYMKQALARGVGSLLPSLLGRLRPAEELTAAHREHDEAIGALLRRAQESGAVRPEISAGDLSLLLACVTRMPGGNDMLRLRYLTLILDGLRPVPDRQVLPGPVPTHDDMAALLFAATGTAQAAIESHGT